MITKKLIAKFANGTEIFLFRNPDYGLKVYRCYFPHPESAICSFPTLAGVLAYCDWDLIRDIYEGD